GGTAGAGGAARVVARRGGRVARLAARRGGDAARAGCRRGEDRVEAVDRLLVAADHHAIAALETPDAAAGADVHIADPLRSQARRPPDVVLVEGIAAVDDDVAALQESAELGDRALRNLAGRQHHPRGARFLQLFDQPL